MKLYVEPMTAGIQKLFNDALQEKILEAHLRAQQAQVNVQNAAKATQAALDNTKATSKIDMQAYIQNAISAGIEKAVKSLAHPNQKNSQGHAKAHAVEPKGNNKRQKSKGKNKEKTSPEPANKRQRTKTQEDDNNAPKTKDKWKKNQQRPNKKRGCNGGKKGQGHQGAAKSDEE